MTLANAVIAGSGRSGTTAMFRYLSEHPEVCVSAKKETNYFEYGIYAVPQPPLEQYERYFARHRDERLVLEASPGYLSDGLLVANEVHRVLGPDCRVVTILREPVDRLVSFYNHAVSHGRIPTSESLLEYVERCRSLPNIRETRDLSSQVLEGYHGGFYLEPVQEWMHVFGDRMRVVFFDDLQRDAALFMSELADWLGIDASYFRGKSLKVENASHAARAKGVHRLAQWFNQQIEPLGERYPRAMRTVRQGYLKVNTRQPERGLSADLVKSLFEDYHAANLALGRFLGERGYVEVPSWLSE